jgi:hypothetical protein
MNVKRARNERISHQVPFGWDEGAKGVLVVNKKQQRVIAWMQRARREGKSLRRSRDCSTIEE